MSDLEIRWGRTKSFDITVTDQGGAVNLNGKALRFAAKRRYADPDPPLIEATPVAKDQGTDPGEATLTIESNMTTSLDPDRTTVLVWEVVLDDAGDAFVVDSGKLAVLPTVDR